MTMDDADDPTTPITDLKELIHDVLSTSCEAGKQADVLLTILRKRHFWPALQVKKFYDRSGLVLLHNTYKRNDVESFRKLYDECRSVILDLSAPEGSNIVVTLANSIPDRMTGAQYKAIMEEKDICQMSYEGTMLSIYEHKGKWYFGTSSCPSVDSSRYFHPTKTHGMMLDDTLAYMFPDIQIEDIKEKSQALRDAFAANLDVKKTYGMILVHHENRHVIDYTEEFANEKYAKLVHVMTRDRITMEEDPIHTTHPFKELGVHYPMMFSSPQQGLDALVEKKNMYGFMVQRLDGKLMKVSNDSVVEREECDLGNPNRWHNLLWVYMQNKPHYHIDDYIRQYAKDISFPKDATGRTMAPTYIIHTVVCTMRDILYNHYISTTSYNPSVKRFKMNKTVDQALSPMLRFHLAQLRHLQVDSHTHALITPKAIYHYICYHQTLKNIRNLITYFATHGGKQMTARQAECFVVLNQLLSE